MNTLLVPLVVLYESRGGTLLNLPLNKERCHADAFTGNPRDFGGLGEAGGGGLGSISMGGEKRVTLLYCFSRFRFIHAR